MLMFPRRTVRHWVGSYIEADGCEVWSPIANLGCPKSQTSNVRHCGTLRYGSANGCMVWSPIANLDARNRKLRNKLEKFWPARKSGVAGRAGATSV